MDDGFYLDQTIYTPREVSRLYSRYVKHASYPTVLDWIQIYQVSGGKQGIEAHKTPRGRYLIAVDEVERILLQAGAKKKEA